MKCPNCNKLNELTWKRYWKSPTGKHQCDQCGTKFKLVYSAQYIIYLAVIALATDGIYSSVIGYDEPLKFIAFIIILCLVIFPADKIFDSKWRNTKEIENEKDLTNGSN